MTEPADATVSYRPYGASDEEWRYIGQSPLDEIRLPRGVFEWRIEKEGYETENWAAANPSALLGNLGAQWGTIVIPVTASDDLPTGMVDVPAVGGPVSISGFNTGNRVQLDPFLVDRHEVTNREFKEFVDAGGYEDPSYWDGLEFRREGREITWEGARRAFIDSTGRPGPATWEAGDYPGGEADYPVGGVSWYEAMAYARFAGKSLPTVYHWSFAALAPGEIISPIGPAIVPMSNFAAAGPARVGSSGAVGPYGTYDTAGNVREWALNASGDLRWILGGGYDDPSYMFSVPLALPPMDRSPLNGFRGVSYSTELTAELSAPIEYRSTDYRDVPPVSDEVYEIYSRQLSYEPSELAATVQETYTSNDWSAERVSYNAGYDGERIDAVVFVPTTGTPPFPALVVFRGEAFQSRSSSEELSDGPNAPNFPLDFVLKSGRALVLPTWNGSFERWDPFLGLSGLEYETTMRERVGEWRRELGMTIDYLAQRDDIDERAVGYLGMSFGASAPLALLAVEDRLRTAVLMSGGFSYRAPDAVHPVSFVERTTLPVLMVNGRYDYVFPLETGPIAYFDRLGTPAEDKSLEIVEAGHWPLPRGQVVGLVLDWLDDRLRPEG
jgi:pimeloyl-ACP methyl ester carboxylesterase